MLTTEIGQRNSPKTDLWQQITKYYSNFTKYEIEDIIKKSMILRNICDTVVRGVYVVEDSFNDKLCTQYMLITKVGQRNFRKSVSYLIIWQFTAKYYSKFTKYSKKWNQCYH